MHVLLGRVVAVNMCDCEGCAGRNQIKFSRHKEQFECNSIMRKQPNCTVQAKWHIESKLLHKWSKAMLQNSACSFAESKFICLDEQNKRFYYNLHNWQTDVFVLQFINCHESTGLKPTVETTFFFNLKSFSNVMCYLF